MRRLFMIMAAVAMLAGCAHRAEEAKPPEKERDTTIDEPVPPPIEATPFTAKKNSVVGEKATSIQDFSKGRINNLKLAAKALNGAVIEPGEVLSFNDRVGPRTEEKGYQKAIIFKDDKQVMEIGGGICQLSTTLYGAALNAGFEIVERHEHSLDVTYAKEGEDATVMYGHLDLKIKNTSSSAVTVEAKITDKEVIVILNA